MAYPEVPSFTVIPQRGQPAQEFSSNVNTMVAEYTPFINGMNELAAWMDGQAEAMQFISDQVSMAVTASETAQDLAEDARDLSQQYRNQAEIFRDQAEAAVVTLPEGTINDAVVRGDLAWSSEKVNEELELKRDLTDNSFPRYDLNNEASTTSLDLSTSNVFEVDARTVSRTLAFSNLPASGRDTTVKLYVRGNNSVTFSDVINWSDAEKPDLGDTWTVLVFSIAGNNIYGNIWGSA